MSRNALIASLEASAEYTLANAINALDWTPVYFTDFMGVDYTTLNLMRTEAIIQKMNKGLVPVITAGSSTQGPAPTTPVASTTIQYVSATFSFSGSVTAPDLPYLQPGHSGNFSWTTTGTNPTTTTITFNTPFSVVPSIMATPTGSSLGTQSPLIVQNIYVKHKSSRNTNR